MEDFTKSELQQSWWAVVLYIQKVPLQGSYSVPVKSGLVLYCTIKENEGAEIQFALNKD